MGCFASKATPPENSIVFDVFGLYSYEDRVKYDLDNETGLLFIAHCAAKLHRPGQEPFWPSDIGIVCNSSRPRIVYMYSHTVYLRGAPIEVWVKRNKYLF